ncbi:MAG TPA: NAD(P)H-hydrate dehydratase [Candidatus Scatomorpha pullicola]|nr:NAD(P)H-hydrate dehydratase [Candidatus Scatomorpha pullicola]
MGKLTARADAPSLLPRRARASSKHDYGRLLIVGGSVGYSGAPTLASRAAVRGGAGLVHLAVPRDIYLVAAMKNDEAMTMPVDCDENGVISAGAIPALMDILPRCDVLAMGPGLGRSRGVAELVRTLALECEAQVVLDADALWALSQFEPDFLSRLGKPAVLTPHEGEFVRHLGGELAPSREAAAERYAREHGCIMVLKGANTVVAFPDGITYVNRSGNPGLARGGSGDALTGIMGALLCQFPADKAVPLAVYLHGLAGDIAAGEKGEYGMTITDVIDALPQAMKLITEE